MFVYIIQYTNWLYFILGILFYISSVYGLFYQYTVVKFEFILILLWMLYLCLLQYVCVINTICSLVVLHIWNLVIQISYIWFVMPLSSSSLNLIQKLDEHLFVWIYHLVVTCIVMHMFVPILSISHIFASTLHYSVVYNSKVSPSPFILNNIIHVTNIIFTLSFREYSVYPDSSLYTHGSNRWN